MNDKTIEARRKYDAALSRLKEAVAEAPSSLQADAVIQRFEFTFEQFWKTLKIYLSDLGIETRSPKEALKSAFKQGWLSDEQVYLDMLEDRNRPSHVYDQADADAIFRRVKEEYLPAFLSIELSLKQAKLGERM